MQEQWEECVDSRSLYEWSFDPFVLSQFRLQAPALLPETAAAQVVE
jgi:hypothetical protein